MKIAKTKFVVPPDFIYKVQEDLDIKPGTIVGLFGPNGVGKTTFLMNIMENSSTGVLQNNYQPKLGFLPQNPQKLNAPWLKGTKLLEIFEQNFNKSKSPYVSLNFPLDIQVKTLSGGQQQLFGLHLLLNHYFDLLLLDEPFSALDIHNTKKIAGNIKKYCQEHKSVFFIVLHDPLTLQFLSDYILLFNPYLRRVHPIENTSKLSLNDFNSLKINSEFHSKCLWLTSYKESQDEKSI